MKVLAIPDLHCPFNHKKAFEFVKGVAKKFKPDKVVCLGDEIDAYNWSRFVHHPDMPAPKEELELARKALAPFYKLFPKVCVCKSNHGDRPLKRAQETELTSEQTRNPKEYLQAPPGWVWEPRWKIDGVWYFHGDSFGGKNPMQKALTDVRDNCVIGHLHNISGYLRLPSFANDKWAMAAGCLIDFESHAFDYCRHLPRTPSLGCVTVVDGMEVNFVPLG
jgi:hypothetical protein